MGNERSGAGAIRVRGEVTPVSVRGRHASGDWGRIHPMFSGLKKQWQAFHRAAPGRRFRDYHERHRTQGLARAWWGRLLIWLAGAACLLVGAFLAVAPGPATLFIIPGAILIASESKLVATGLDRIDVRLAPVIAFLSRRWRRLSKRMQLAIKIVTACGSIALMMIGVFLMFR